jgi:hypothetical protein
MLSRLVPPACVLLSFPAAISAQDGEPALVLRPDPQRAAARAAVIDLLHEYRTRGVFGQNVGFPGLREPYFVDDAGRRCAVAWLLDGTAGSTAAPGVRAAALRALGQLFAADPAPHFQPLAWRADRRSLAPAPAWLAQSER